MFYLVFFSPWIEESKLFLGGNNWTFGEKVSKGMLQKKNPAFSFFPHSSKIIYIKLYNLDSVYTNLYW